MVIGGVALWCTEDHPLFGPLHLVYFSRDHQEGEKLRLSAAHHQWRVGSQGAGSLVSVTVAPSFSSKPAEGAVEESQGSPC